ncbi:MAG: hypothetical protein M3P30_13625 [Chloroflexota bacterium]|nr:hypothetical protein [Chloroflexota bacterium]
MSDEERLRVSGRTYRIRNAETQTPEHSRLAPPPTILRYESCSWATGSPLDRSATPSAIASTPTSSPSTGRA